MLLNKYLNLSLNNKHTLDSLPPTYWYLAKTNNSCLNMHHIYSSSRHYYKPDSE